jgi:hypothetical protein
MYIYLLFRLWAFFYFLFFIFFYFLFRLYIPGEEIGSMFGAMITAFTLLRWTLLGTSRNPKSNRFLCWAFVGSFAFSRSWKRVSSARRAFTFLFNSNEIT